MTKHPCEEGLTPACFAAYPAWARQALAYKLLHIILPKQITRMLPRMPIPPGFAWSDTWTAWLYFIFQGDELPWMRFPKDWRPGDPLPPGVTFPPDVTLPPDFNPDDHPPEFYIPGYTPIVTPPDTGAEAPIHVRSFEPGPIGGSYSSAPVAFDIGSLLVEQGTINNTLKIGQTDNLRVLAKAIITWMSAEIHAIDIKIGKNVDPTGTIKLEIWITNSSYKPVLKVGGGDSDIKTQDSLPFYSIGVDYTRFLFVGKPILALANRYAIVIRTTRDPEGWDYLTLGRDSAQSRNYYWDIPGTGWTSQWGPIINCRVWGIAL